MSKIDSLYIDSTEDTPEVKFDAEKNFFSLSKRSYPENAIDFYNPIISWIKLYGRKPNEKTNFIFDLEYFNTASSKQIMKLILELEKLSNKSSVTIDWKYKDIDEDMLSLGVRFQKLVELEFNFIEIPSED